MNIKDIPKFVINLERDSHKLKRFSKPMKEQNIEFKIWRGVILTNKKKLHEYNKKFRYTQRTKTLNKPGNVGSSFAHLSLWRYCLTQESDYFMIFEDNCVIKDNFLENVNNFLKKNERFDFFNLNVIRPSGFTKDNKLFKYRNLKLTNNYNNCPNTWMSSYIISKNIIHFLLNMSCNINFDTQIPIDKIIMYILNTIKGIKYYSIKTNYLTNHMESQHDTRKQLNKKKISVNSYITEEPIDFKA